MQWIDFDNYVDIVKSIRKITLSKNCTVENEEWKTGMCNCPIFYKQYTCKHMMRNKILTIPLIAKNIPMDAKRKRGRPAKAKMAMLFQ